MMSKEATVKTSDHKLTIGEVLRLMVQDGMVPKEEAEKLYQDYKHGRSTLHPLVILGERKWKSLKPPHKALTVEFLTEWLAEKVGLPYFHIDPLKLNFGAIANIVSKAYADRLKIMPVMVSGKEVTIVTSEPYLTDWIPDLERMISIRIKLALANPVEINRYLPEVYSLANSVQLANEAKTGQVVGVQNFEQLVELGKSKNLDANEQHIVNIVDWLFQYAFEQRASDIHLEPRRDVGLVRFRIDGVLHQVYQLPSTIMNAITSRIKLLGRMDMVEKRRPQDGRLKTLSMDSQEIELRLSTMPTAFGEKLVMRIFNPDILVKDFAELGFSREHRSLWDKWVRQPNGIILVTGPTGSGKTTTLYSTLKQLATPEVNVCTVEEPIEMIEPSFNQMQVQHNIGLTFADGIRTLLRQDPDIIMVGEIRDLETAEMAIQASLTGHLVISTLHTNDAASAVTRLLDLGVPYYLINSTLLGVMAQRLVRTLCSHCKAESEVSDTQWQELVAPWKLARPAKAYTPVGCLECRMTGFRGRTGLYEMLPVSPALKKCVTKDADLGTIKAQVFKEGMIPLRINGAEKVAAGVTTIDEVMKVAPPPLD